MNQLAEFVHPVEGATRTGVAGGDMIAIVREMLAGRQARRLADNLVPLDDEATAIGLLDHPFSAEQGDRAVGFVLDRDKIDERMRLALGQAIAAMMMDEPVKVGRETRYFAGGLRHAGRSIVRCWNGPVVKSAAGADFNHL